MLTAERGRIVQPASPSAFAAEFIELLGDAELRATMGRKAYEHSRGMVWWEVGSRYRLIFDRATSAATSAAGRSSGKFAAVIA
jgi:hypothetical protein